MRENSILCYWAEGLSSVTVTQDQGCHDIVDLPQDNGTNTTNSYSLKGKVAPNIILFIKIKNSVSQSPVTPGICLVVMSK